MIDVPTLFILGAGASVPYGYPTGKELRKEIVINFCKELEKLLLPNDDSIRKVERARYLPQANEFVDAFNKSSIESIDKFLSFNPRFSSIGKIAITLSILLKEQSSRFREDMEPSANKQNWYSLLFNQMVSSFTDPDDFKKFSDNKIAFITFNYDRSLEQFLFESFINTFSEKMSAFGKKLKEYIPFPLIHVYGQVDAIVWHGGRDYKADFDFKTIVELSTGIRVIGERTNNFEVAFPDFFKKFKRLFFLGFGYAEENLNAISIPDTINENWNIYGTAKGMTAKEIAKIRGVFQKNSSMNNPWVEDKTCYDLLREYL